jgi:excinuclease ABC subunit C
MKGFFRRLVFTGGGPNRLHPGLEVLLVQLRGRRPRKLCAGVREQAPRLPGVYGMIDIQGELIYVGKAKCLRSRLLSYFRPNSRDPKAGRILAATRRIVWEVCSSEFAALLRELELIRRWQPRFNVQGQPLRRRRAYVCIGRRPAQYVFTAPRPPRTASAVFGPVPAGRKTAEAVRRINDWFRLRDCPQSQEMVFRDQQELFPVLRTPGCLRHEIGNCLGPCAAACTQAEYSACVAAAIAFLDGRNSSPLEMVEREMIEAASKLEFERAVVLRDRLEVLRWLCGRLEHLRQCAQESFVYPVQGHEGAELWYLIHGGRVRAVGAPGDRVALAKVYGGKQGTPGPPRADEMDGVLLVTAWFRRYREERSRTLTPEAALAHSVSQASEPGA